MAPPSKRGDSVLDRQVPDEVEKLARLVERAEPELPRGVAVDENLSLVRRSDFEKSEQLTVGHAPDHETITFSVHLEAAFGHVDGAPMRVDLRFACHHVRNVGARWARAKGAEIGPKEAPR